jgi:hypothetical protein
VLAGLAGHPSMQCLFGQQKAQAGAYGGWSRATGARSGCGRTCRRRGVPIGARTRWKRRSTVPRHPRYRQFRLGGARPACIATFDEESFCPSGDAERKIETWCRIAIASGNAPARRHRCEVRD